MVLACLDELHEGLLWNNYTEGAMTIRTFHDNVPNHGRSRFQKRTFRTEGQYHGWFDIKQRSLPRWRSKSWTVQGYSQTILHTETTAGRLAGPFPEPGAALPVCSRRRCFFPAAVPSLTMAENTSQKHMVNYMSQNLAVGITDDPVSRIEPSMLKQDIVDGSPRIKGHSTVEPISRKRRCSEPGHSTIVAGNLGRPRGTVTGFRKTKSS